MTIGIWFGAQVLFWSFYVIFANEIGVLSDVFGGIAAPLEPSGGSFLDQVLAPFAYAWEWAKSLFKFITFQAVGIPPVMGVTVVLGLQAVNAVLLWRLIRAG